MIIGGEIHTNYNNAVSKRCEERLQHGNKPFKGADLKLLKIQSFIDWNPSLTRSNQASFQINHTRIDNLTVISSIRPQTRQWDDIGF